MNGNPCGRCGSYLDPHTCPPRWDVTAEAAGVVLGPVAVHAADASIAATDAAKHLGLGEGVARMTAVAEDGRRWSGLCRTKLELLHVAALYRD